MEAGSYEISGEEQPVLHLTEDQARVEQLKAKLKEYQERLKAEQAARPHVHPAINGSLATKMKIGILGNLLEKGELPMWDYSLEFAGEHLGYIQAYGTDLFEHTWNYASNVIKDYNDCGGAHGAGKGLPATN